MYSTARTILRDFGPMPKGQKALTAVASIDAAIDRHKRELGRLRGIRPQYVAFSRLEELAREVSARRPPTRKGKAKRKHNSQSRRGRGKRRRN